MTESFWPTPQQELLLAIALGGEDEATAAWREVRLQLDLDRLEPGSFALMPLVYRALSQAEAKDSRLERLKGIYRSTWAKNNLLAERAKEAASELGGRVAVLGGISTAQRFYGDLALRPTPAVDLLVERAAESVEPAGWRLTSAGPVHWYENGDGRLLTIRSAISPDFAAVVWDAVEPLELRGGKLLALSPADELLAACVLGARAAAFHSITWIPDAVLVIRSGSVDWDRVVDRTLTFGQTLRVRQALEYLAGRIDVPTHVREGLGSAPVSGRERAAHRLTTTRFMGLGGLPHTLGEHLGAGGGLRTLPAVLRERWSVDHGRQLPVAVGRRAWHAVRGRPS